MKFSNHNSLVKKTKISRRLMSVVWGDLGLLSLRVLDPIKLVYGTDIGWLAGSN